MKARVTGKQTIIKVHGAKVGEVDSFSARKLDSYKLSRPIGYAVEHPNMKHGGWELSFSGGKVDTALARVIHAQEFALAGTSFFPTFEIEHIINHYNGKVEKYTYENAILFGYEFNAQNATDDLTESFKGYASNRQWNLTPELTKDVFSLATHIETEFLGELVQGNALANAIVSNLGVNSLLDSFLPEIGG